jgi:hypothetical protein
MAEQIFISHNGSGTFFGLDDDVQLISATDVENNDSEALVSGDISDVAVDYGYTITPELAQILYEVAMNYHEKGVVPVIQ